ncbi:MAG: alpha/beta hydrolase [Alistipes sp.]|nr:alpha/beta hydrolase [Alistipes sp.]
MKRIVILTTIALATMALNASAQTYQIESSADEVIRYWDNSTAPHSNNETEPEALVGRGYKSFRLEHTSDTYFYTFKAQNPTGHAVVVFPSGGYSAVNVSFSLAEWLRECGITAMVVKYRLPNGVKEVPLEDAAAAISYLRQNAQRLGIDPQKVGVLGASAGGHLAAWSSNVLEGEQKPNYAVLLYPAISGEIWACKVHWLCFKELLGKWCTGADIETVSVNRLVTAQTPPTLILHSDDDLIAPSYGSILYYKALKQYGVKASMHIFPVGDHGWQSHKDFLYRNLWRESVKDWILAH